MELPTYFNDFLTEIRLTKNQREDCIRGHTTLRERLANDEDLSDIVVSTFLQGSYRRATAIRPKNGVRADVDVIVVTKLSRHEYTDPEKAMLLFRPFLKEHYSGKYHIQGRSFGIELTYVDLDLVITSAPSESEIRVYSSDSVLEENMLEDLGDWRPVQSWVAPDKRTSKTATVLLEKARSEPLWKTEPLYIPDREAKSWQPTHPLAQIVWTWEKNRACNRHYVNVVKALKWWQRVNHPDSGRPKGYPLEHLIGLCCPDGITSVATGITAVLERIVQDYASYAQSETVPTLCDHGVPEHDVFARISGEEFAVFYDQVGAAAQIARRALEATDVTESATEWRRLFGSKFPVDPDQEDNSGGTKMGEGGYTPRTGPSVITGGRYA